MATLRRRADLSKATRSACATCSRHAWTPRPVQRDLVHRKLVQRELVHRKLVRRDQVAWLCRPGPLLQAESQHHRRQSNCHSHRVFLLFVLPPGSAPGRPGQRDRLNSKTGPRRPEAAASAVQSASPRCPRRRGQTSPKCASVMFAGHPGMGHTDRSVGTPRGLEAQPLLLGVVGLGAGSLAGRRCRSACRPAWCLRRRNSQLERGARRLDGNRRGDAVRRPLPWLVAEADALTLRARRAGDVKPWSEIRRPFASHWPSLVNAQRSPLRPAHRVRRARR